MARTSEDDLNEARALKRRARHVRTPMVRRRLQRVAERLESRAAAKVEARLRKRVPGGAGPGRGNVKVL